MAGRYDKNPFDEDEDEANPFSDPAVRNKSASNFGSGAFFAPNAPTTNSRRSPLASEPADIYDPDATVDITLDTVRANTQDLKKKEKELRAKETELRRREQTPPIIFKGKSLAGILAVVDVISRHVLVGQVYMYFRGSGKEAKMKREAARGAMRAALS